MHAPDGFLTPEVAIVTALVSGGGLSLALRQCRRQPPATALAGLSGAFVFAAQMVNFPIATGTSGHVIGGVLLAILLGPSLGVVVLSTVFIVQALVFADGGITALGYNVLNGALVTTLGGYGAYLLFRRLLPATRSGVVAAAALSGWLSVVLAAAAVSLLWLVGATAPVPFDTVFAAMVGVHALIGIGEGAVTAMVLAAVLSARPDLAAGLGGSFDTDASGRRVEPRSVVLGGAMVTVVVAGVISQISVGTPDGLERVAGDHGLGFGRSSLLESPFADYALVGLGNERLSLVVAGLSGAIIMVLVVSGLTASLSRRRRRPDPSVS